jgi:hypothetical protein
VQDRVWQLAHRGAPATAVIARQLQGQALVMSFEDGFRLAMVAILIGLALVLVLKRARGPVPVGAH